MIVKALICNQCGVVAVANRHDGSVVDSDTTRVRSVLQHRGWKVARRRGEPDLCPKCATPPAKHEGCGWCGNCVNCGRHAHDGEPCPTPEEP